MKFKPPGQEPLSIGLTSGHSIVIPPEGREVPAAFRKAAVAEGCVPMGIGAEEGAAQQAHPETKEDKIIEGIEKLLDGDDESAFTTDGKPDTRKLADACGFGVSRQERDAAWAVVSESMKGDGE